MFGLIRAEPSEEVKDLCYSDYLWFMRERGCGSRGVIYFLYLVTFKFLINTYGFYNDDSEPVYYEVLTRGDFGDFCLIDNKEITLDPSDTSCYLFLY